MEEDGFEGPNSRHVVDVAQKSHPLNKSGDEWSRKNGASPGISSLMMEKIDNDKTQVIGGPIYHAQ